MRKVTQKHIAEVLGISQNSVSQILRGQGQYQRETYDRVWQVAREMNYRPNFYAKAIRNERLGNYALLQPENVEAAKIPHRLLFSITSELEKSNCHLTFSRLSDALLTDKNYVPNILRELVVDGLFIFYCEGAPVRMRRLISDANIPSIWLNSNMPEDAIRPDDYQAALEFTRAFIQKGHKNIVFANQIPETAITNPDRHYSIRERYNGYKDAMKEAGLKPAYTQTHQSLQKEKAKGLTIEEALARPNRPTAIIAYANWNASAALYAAARLGLKVPDDLMVGLFHNKVFTEFSIALPTVVLPYTSMGREAIEMMEQKLSSPKVKVPTKKLPCELFLQPTIDDAEPYYEEL